MQDRDKDIDMVDIHKNGYTMYIQSNYTKYINLTNDELFRYGTI